VQQTWQADATVGGVGSSPDGNTPHNIILETGVCAADRTCSRPADPELPIR